MPETKIPEGENKEFLKLVAHLPIQDSILLARYIDATIAERSRFTAIGFAEWIGKSQYTQADCDDFWYEPPLYDHERIGICVAVSTEALYDLYLKTLTIKKGE